MTPERRRPHRPPASWGSRRRPAGTVTSSGGNYTVKRGDTLGKIASAHGKSWKALYEANRGALANSHVLMVGTSLHV